MPPRTRRSQRQTVPAGLPLLDSRDDDAGDEQPHSNRSQGRDDTLQHGPDGEHDAPPLTAHAAPDSTATDRDEGPARWSWAARLATTQHDDRDVVVVGALGGGDAHDVVEDLLSRPASGAFG